jgi:uncharacterized protein (DUF2336 family)
LKDVLGFRNDGGLEWAWTASPVERVEGAGMLARAFLYGDLAEPEREEARLVLTGLLDDSSPLVRRALAENFASAATAPHYMVLTLAGEQSDIAAIVLSRSPLLSDAELVDCAAASDAFEQSAIALRPSVSAPVAAALSEVGCCEALISLAVALRCASARLRPIDGWTSAARIALRQ